MNPEEILISKQNKECIICHEHINSKQAFICLQCRNYCSPVYKWVGKDVTDITSSCCNYDVEIISKITCSEKCHEKFVELMENEYGKTKKVTVESGITYEVPTRDFIEKQIRYEDLPKYPLWNDLASEMKEADVKYEDRRSKLNEWRESMCTKMQKSLNHCETPDGNVARRSLQRFV